AYEPAPAGGALPVRAPGGSAWLRSRAAFAQQTLEGRVSFGAGPWQHLGWGADGFADRWAILSTGAAGDRLFARTFDGARELTTELPGVALGVYHDVRIAWTAAAV